MSALNANVSIMYEDECAGSNTTAITNPIDEVLGFFGATMVGN